MKDQQQQQKMSGGSPRGREQDSEGEEEDADEQAQQSRATTRESARYGDGLTAAQVAAATRDAAVLAQDLVDFSLEGFATCGKMKDEVDLAEEIYQLLSAMKVPTKAVEEVGAGDGADGLIGSQELDTDSLSSDEDGDIDGDSSALGGEKEEEIVQASPAR